MMSVDIILDIQTITINMIKTEARGGKREGSGRPKLPPTKVLAYRVPVSKAIKIDKAIRKLLSGFFI